MKNRDFVIVGLQSWDIEIGSNSKNIALEISKNNRVLYVNCTLNYNLLLKSYNDPYTKRRLNAMKDNKENLFLLQSNLWNLYPRMISHSINWISNKSIHNFLNKNNNRRLANEIALAIKKLEFKNVIIFNDNDFLNYLYLKDYICHDKYVYYLRDNLAQQDYFKNHGERESQLMKDVDIVLTNSNYLADYAKTYNDNTHFVGQGCDLDIFTNKALLNTPEDMENISTPIIGYTGALVSSRLDILKIIQIATELIDYSIVLVGPEDEEFKKSKLHSISNVYFLGAKGPDEIPAYINGFDVCINPQILNEMTIGNYPRKIDEYLAMGKPVVATKTNAMEYFKEHVFLADDNEEYIQLLKKAIKENSADKALARREFALTHSWENNVKDIYNKID